jgi:hypothetical protein
MKQGGREGEEREGKAMYKCPPLFKEVYGC